ncbi:MAG: DUF2029 domain-containing protein [Afipia sp.]|nr:DUF2029 domain-containing protein [Afipia sp.]
MRLPRTLLRYPSFRVPVDILFFIACIGLTADVLVPEIFGHGKSKDYALWYWAGQQVLSGGDLYARGGPGQLEFIYLPLPAVLLALPAYFGKIVLYSTLSVINIISWWVAGQLSNAMAGSDRVPSVWLAALPGIVTVTFVFDMFDLGQPNLLLLALMLVGFWWIDHGRPIAAGAMFALATGIKVFPIAVLPYLLWRRRWRVASSLVVFLGIFLFLLPASVRGFQRNIAELGTWYQAMIGSTSEKGFGQRDAQNWSWVNQSIIAVTHRLTRPVNYEQDNPFVEPKYVNVANLDFKTANYVVIAVSLLIGLGFIWVMPAQSNMTPRSNAEELAILLSLMTVASPLARQYYFVWLLFPYTVLIQRAAFDPRPNVRKWTWASLWMAGGLLALSLPVFPKLFQALGNNLAATMLLVIVLVWHMRHPPEHSTQAIRTRPV